MDEHTRDDEPVRATGIDQLLALAALDAEVEQAVRDGDLERLPSLGVAITPVETRILAATPRSGRTAMVARISARLPDDTRRAFFSGATVTVSLLAAVVAGMGGGAGCGGAVKGARPDRPDRQPQPKSPADAGADPPRERPRPDPRSYPAPTGIRPG